MNLPGFGLPDNGCQRVLASDVPRVWQSEALPAADPKFFLRRKSRMALTMYAASIPVFQRVLGNLEVILGKGQAHAESHGIDPLVLTSARLYPDMLPLTAQVFIAADMCKGAAARLSGQEAPAWADEERSFPELIERVARTRAYIATVSPESFEGSETRDIVLKLRTRTLEFKGQDYLTGFVLPNLYFHVATCYGILRHNGVALGKADFLGG